MKQTPNISLKKPDQTDVVNIEDLNQNFDTIDTEIKGAKDRADEAFQSASDGKRKIATAITGKGVPTSSSDTFQAMSTNINAIETDKTGDATAVSEDILATKIAYAKGVKLTGTMPNNGSVGTKNLNTEGAEYTIPAGYHNGLGKVKAVITGLIASVIKAGTTVGGVLGTFTADATATASQMLSGVTAYINGNKVTGTITSKAAATITPGTTDQTIASGQYLSGVQTIKGDANLLGANIISGKSIFGVVGTKVGAPINVYTGTTEPITFEGIWVNTSQSLTSVVGDLELWFANAWNNTSLVNYALPISNIYAVGSASVDNNIYVMGGSTASYKIQNLKYDTITNVWTKAKDIPVAIDGIALSSVGSNIYATGTFNASGVCYRYNTITNVWDVMATLPLTLQAHSSVAVGTDIYIIGGHNGSTASNVTYKYNTINNTWSQMANMQIDSTSASACAIGTDIYYVGGQSTNGIIRSESYKYNTQANVWSAITSCPMSCIGHRAVGVGTNMHITGSAHSKTAHYKYDSLTNTWSTMVAVPMDVSYHAAVYCNSAMHLMTYTTGNRRFNFTSKSYTNGTVVLYRVNGMYGAYPVELVTPSVRFGGNNNRMLTGIDNVYAYVSGTLQENLPTYYGNGTSWVKFKG